MIPLKPYLIRAVYDWLVDNDFTPYLLVDAEVPSVDVPRQYVQEGRIVLNLRPQAVQHLDMNNREVTFSARFGGTPTRVYIPISAVMALYARENGQGMVFDQEEGPGGGPPTSPEPQEPAQKKRPALRVVK
ncbi:MULTISPECIES: ClpXP protease specificity-enhancing factor [Methylococcus]|jgi:stringent starvation protein B|uniref:Stringent starvation protein B n=2 Tax=Methylococcus capsulatus TaxID=414 RepID=Q606Q7_METCA|nr:ClpXP protease specificity-enhancing factor [Methylococcus capsulatus]AAU92032.1 stringent starvation protein B [Methylococcus capsulatus str. Bath]QXP87416.1 ClpXP protease specificity-enhancing factor [Methylococcus capsulatus]QXP91230.1 ClpXP protease specificity-enhancing factor [Methylococcus capsulatus]QXP92843.1 ClpXP protease specificity-enhancing factor [Methylococcus capsulatus]UQN12419.1 ClpXP protease specificity-enhancing factor [Methylococcus capsulatus]